MNVTKVSFYKEKIFSARWFQTWGTLLLGSMVIATGYTFFMTPYQIVPGGIYGISTILNWKLGFPIGMAALCFNLPLSLIGFKILGRDFGLSRNEKRKVTVHDSLEYLRNEQLREKGEQLCYW